MTQTTETGYKSTLAKPLSASDTSMFVATAPTITKGRIRIYSGNRQEWVSFTGVSGTELTGLTRGLSQTAVPATGGTGQSWIGGTKIEIVSMHDQLADKQEDNDFNGTITTDSIRFEGTDTSGLRIKSLTTTQRDALTPATGDKIFNTTTGTEQTYYGGTWNDAASGTTANASTTVAGKVELSTAAERAAGTSTGGTGAALVPTNDALVKTSSGASDENKISVLDSKGSLQQFTKPSLYDTITETVDNDTLSVWDTSEGEFKEITIDNLLKLPNDTITQYTANTGFPIGSVFTTSYLTTRRTLINLNYVLSDRLDNTAAIQVSSDNITFTDKFIVPNMSGFTTSSLRQGNITYLVESGIYVRGRVTNLDTNKDSYITLTIQD